MSTTPLLLSEVGQSVDADMSQAREVTTCLRCRKSKRRCDKAKPSCTRCERGGTKCIYEEDPSTARDERQILIESRSDGRYPTPATTPPTLAQKVKKRNRACLSCTRCHRLKVKCDQAEPCARCVRSGVPGCCTYTHRPKALPPLPRQIEQRQHREVPFAIPEDDCELVVATWFLRKQGSTHYRAILNRVRLDIFICHSETRETM